MGFRQLYQINITKNFQTGAGLMNIDFLGEYRFEWGG
jgi:hypothetical protein